MCYNVEILFDTADDPCKEDNEFLPDGNRYWTRGRYYHKLRQIAKTISAAGEWDTPALVGLCEVENDSVLHELTRRSPLRAQEYRYLITQGSDPRGINVALLYQRDRFGYIGHEAIPIRFTRERHKQSRDILHVWGKIQTGDTLDVFVCHFPSRYGGEKESEQDRLDAARTLRENCDSIYRIRKFPYLIIMGDFNDTPISYAHRTIQGDLVDAFAESGRGMGVTYNQNFFWFRIDNILHSPNMTAFNCSVDKVSYSDHYPLWCYLRLE